MRLCVCVCKGHTAIVSLALAKEAVCDITNKGVGECTNVRTQVHWLGLSSKALSVSWAQSYARLSTGLQLNNSSVCVSLCICMYALQCFITMCVYTASSGDQPRLSPLPLLTSLLAQSGFNSFKERTWHKRKPLAFHQILRAKLLPFVHQLFA